MGFPKLLMFGRQDKTLSLSRVGLYQLKISFLRRNSTEVDPPHMPGLNAIASACRLYCLQCRSRAKIIFSLASLVEMMFFIIFLTRHLCSSLSSITSIMFSGVSPVSKPFSHFALLSLLLFQRKMVCSASSTSPSYGQYGFTGSS